MAKQLYPGKGSGTEIFCWRCGFGSAGVTALHRTWFVEKPLLLEFGFGAAG